MSGCYIGQFVIVDDLASFHDILTIFPVDRVSDLATLKTDPIERWRSAD